MAKLVLLDELDVEGGEAGEDLRAVSRLLQVKIKEFILDIVRVSNMEVKAVADRTLVECCTCR